MCGKLAEIPHPLSCRGGKAIGVREDTAPRHIPDTISVNVGHEGFLGFLGSYGYGLLFRFLNNVMHQ